jgi:Sulfotransferase family
MIDIDLVRAVERVGSVGNLSFDLPNTGRVNGMAFRVAGWFRVPSDQPIGLVRFSLADVKDAHPADCRLREVRPEIRQDVPCGPEQIALGFDSYVDGIILPRTFRILVSYCQELDDELALGEVCGRHSLIVGKYTAEFQPIAVFHAGRMGSTAMMRALLAHPEIVVDDRHPYEYTSAGYFSHASSILLRTRDFENRNERNLKDRESENAGWLIPSLEPNMNLSPDIQQYEDIERNLASLASEVSDFARAAIDVCYRPIRAQTNKPKATFFAEKVFWQDSIDAFLWLYPKVKLILLTRDPRDSFRSARDFNAKRSIAAFGREYVTNDKDWIDFRSRWMRRMVRTFDFHAEEDRLVVRFEDLMADTLGAMRRVCAFLDIDSSISTVKAMENAALEETPESMAHRTSSRGHEVGEWRRGLTSEEATQIVDRSRVFMRRFGYDEDIEGGTSSMN